MDEDGYVNICSGNYYVRMEFTANVGVHGLDGQNKAHLRGGGAKTVVIVRTDDVDVELTGITFEDGDHLACVGCGFAMHHVIFGVDRQAPDLVETVGRVALFQYQLELGGLCRKAHRLVVSAIDLFRFAGRFPLAIDAAEAPRPGHVAAVGIDDLEQVFAPQGLVDRVMHVAGPRSRLQHHLVETEHLGLVISRVIEVHPQGRRRLRKRVGAAEQRNQ